MELLVIQYQDGENTDMAAACGPLGPRDGGFLFLEPILFV